MPDVLIAYASSHGTAREVAERAAEAVRARGSSPRLADLVAGDAPDPAAFDRVLVAASVHAGVHHWDARDWLRRHHAALNRRPTTLLSVSLTADDDTPEARAARPQAMAELIGETAWQPSHAHAVALQPDLAQVDAAARELAAEGAFA
ncbi:MAG TPA: flavodoxin domain-containing protein [Baekduia sp.]|nr:flavodoxin domain-containing protein [Baekduia sp.]